MGAWKEVTAVWQHVQAGTAYAIGEFALEVLGRKLVVAGAEHECRRLYPANAISEIVLHHRLEARYFYLQPGIPKLGVR